MRRLLALVIIFPIRMLLLMLQHRCAALDGMLENAVWEEDQETCPLTTDEEHSDQILHIGDDNEDIMSNSNSISEFFGVFRRLGIPWDYVLRSYMRVVGSAGGTIEDGDTFAENVDEALVLLRDMAKDVVDIPIIGYHEFGKTVDDLLVTFIHWAATNGAEDHMERCHRMGGVNGWHEKINVSKAFRRLEIYISWMKEGEKDLLDAPLMRPSVKEAMKAFSMHLSIDDCGRIVWWLDLEKTDIRAVKLLQPSDIRRFFVSFAHILMFDERAQKNGVVFVHSFADISFWTFMTMLPLELGIKTDEFLICAIPLNTKLVMFLNRPAWANLGYGLLRVFLTSQMRRRVVMMRRKRQQEVVEDAVGTESIPIGFDGIEGKQSIDLLAFSVLVKDGETHEDPSETSIGKEMP